MPDITVLNQQIEHLTRVVNGWNTAIIVLMVCAAISAAGLVIAQRFAFKYGEKLAFASGELVSVKESIAEGKTARAQQAGAEANERALHAEVGVSEAKADASRANEKAAEAQTAQQEVQIKLATQQERAAIAEQDLARIKLQLQPRRLTAAQKQSIRYFLGDSKKGPISVTTLMNNGESQDFGDDLADALEHAGWDVGPSRRSQVMMSGNVVGLFVKVHSASSAPPGLAELREALNFLGVSLVPVIDQNIPAGTADIFVGGKTSETLK